jgi:AraC-like DNA-binding protein
LRSARIFYVILTLKININTFGGGSCFSFITLRAEFPVSGTSLPECGLSRLVRQSRENFDMRQPLCECAHGELRRTAYVCGNTLVHLEDSELHAPVRHNCRGGDRSLWLLFQLDGVSDALLDDRRYCVKPGNMLLLFGPDAHRRVECLGAPRFRRAIIKLGEEFLQRYFTDGEARLPGRLEKLLIGDEPGAFCRAGRIAPDMDVSLQEVFQSPYQGQLGVMFAESRALDVVCSSLSALLDAEGEAARGRFGGASGVSQGGGVSVDDAERLHRARDILLTDLTSPPPGISALARLVGLNESKLKRGFRQIFGTTVHGCHRNARMDLARKMMLDGRHNVCEVACAVGYSNPSHFTRAFFNRFRVNPGAYLRDLRKQGYHGKLVSRLLASSH